MIDMKGFKKVADDGKVATMSHPSGHTVKIVKSALSKPVRKQLDGLPLHQSDPEGPVADPSDDTMQGDAPPPQQPPQQVPGGTTININAAASPPPQPEPSQISQVRPPEAGQNVLSQVQGGTPIAPVQAVPPPAPPAPPAPPTDPYTELPGGKEKLAAIQGTAQAQMAQATTEQRLAHQQAQANQQFLAQFQQNFKDHQAEVAAATADVKNGHINPNHFVENMSVPAKISTAIGLILGGIGAGKHGTNPALAYLNKQVENDLDAQKTNQSNKLNLLTALDKKYQNQAVAENMFRAIRYNVYADQMTEAAKKSAGPLAQSQALNAISDWKNAQIPVLQKASLMQMERKVNGGTYDEALANRYREAARFIDPKMAEDFDKRHIPGVGVATVPLEPKDRDLLQKKTELSALLQHANDFMKEVGPMGAWAPSTVSKGQALQNQINLTMGELSDLTRFSAEENKIYKQNVPDLSGTHFSGKDQAILNTLLQRNNDSLNTFFVQKGLPNRAKLPSHNQTFKAVDPQTGKVREYRKAD